MLIGVHVYLMLMKVVAGTCNSTYLLLPHAGEFQMSATTYMPTEWNLYSKPCMSVATNHYRSNSDYSREKGDQESHCTCIEPIKSA